MNEHNLLGKSFGRWSVIAEGPRSKYSTRQWLCRCVCGTEKIIAAQSLRKGSSKSCGCLNSELAAERCRQLRTKHGHNRKGHRSKEYHAWRNMISRCNLECVERFKVYGSRGISVCERWKNSFEAFLEDVGFAPSTDHSIGRIDNNGNYEPGNVRWETLDQQLHNTSYNRWLTLNGETLTIGDWAKKTGIERRTIQARLDVGGWPVEKALTTPVTKRSK